MMITTIARCALVLFATMAISLADAKVRMNTYDKYRRSYNTDPLKRLKFGHADEFSFGRFQTGEAIERAMNDCRSTKSFKHYNSKDGREGTYCSTRLGDDWVLAESKQIAKNCRPEEVLDAYLDGENQKRWNKDKVKDIGIKRTGFGVYRQEMVLKPQRVLTGKTTVMRYTQVVRVDMIGKRGFNAFVELDANSKTNTAQRPFDVLAVNVSLEQVGEDVNIYAAGLMRVNRSVVPNLIVFDASGIAGAMAGKGTLWLSSHFAKREADRKREQQATHPLTARDVMKSVAQVIFRI